MAPAHPSPFERGRFPVWTSLSAGNLCYGFPCLHEGYVKVAEDSKVGDTTVDVWRQPTRAFLALDARGRRRPHPFTRRRRSFHYTK